MRVLATGDRQKDAPLEAAELEELATMADQLEIRTSKTVEDLDLIDIAIAVVLGGGDRIAGDPDRTLCRCGRWKMDHFDNGQFIADRWNCGAFEEEL